MYRLLVALLSAFDAVIAAAAGLAAILAPLTLLWVFGLGAGADWGALWPTTGTIWLLGNLVPQQVALPAEYLVLVGIPADAANFALSLAPLAFALFTAVFAARSGARAARAGAWITGTVTGAAVYAALAAVVVATSANDVVASHPAQGILVPALLYLVVGVAGAVVRAWNDGDDGLIDRLGDALDGLPGQWGAVPGLIARGASIALAGLIGAAALAVGILALVRAGDVVALFQAAHVDGIGATAIALGQLAYLPTIIIWALAWLSGPGFAFGVGTSVTPAGTHLGVLPGIPTLGLLPEGGSPWMLLVLLVPVAAGAFAGWAIRSRLAADRGARADGFGPRLAVTVGIAVVTGALAALLAHLASGSIGPDRLAVVGPAAGPVALAVGLEVLVGAAILLLGPLARRPRQLSAERR